MTKAQKILNILKANNPFSSNAAGDPREERYPDVSGLGDEAFEGIRGLIGFKGNKPSMQCAGAVIGEAGSGKTHLIGRLIDGRENGPVPYNFAYIYPFIDPYQGFRYLLREIVVNLTSKYKGDKFSQLDVLAAYIGCRVLERIALEGGNGKLTAQNRALQKCPTRLLTTPIFPETITKKLINFGIKFLSEKNPSFNQEFLKVVLRYCFFPKTRPAAIQWLMGRTIASDQVRLLGVGDRGSKQVEALEEEAQEIIGSLDMLFFLHGRPMVVFFDQLENLSGIEQIKTFQKMIFCLGDKSKAMLPMAFFRGQDWEEKFKEKMDDFCLGRFKANLFDLKGCDREQSFALVRSRLSHALADIESPNDLFPFHPDHREALLRMLEPKEMHPRQVINRASRLLHQILYGTAPKNRGTDIILKEAYKTRYEEVLANHEQYSPDESRLTLALSLYLSNRPHDFPYNVSKIKTSLEKEKYIDLAAQVSPGGKKGVPVVIMVDVELHHRSVFASLRRGIAFLGNNPGAKVIYIRDSRCPFHGPERWKQNNQAKVELERLGGLFILSPIREIARLYALALLKFDIQAGDITSDTGQAIAPERLGEFIRSEINGNSFRIFSRLDKYFSSPEEDNGAAPPPSPAPAPEPPVDDMMIARLAVEILNQSPTKMMKADLLSQKISGKAKTNTDTDQVVLILGEHKESFRIFRARDGVLISLKVR